MGLGQCLYTELIDLSSIGSLEVHRASTIEFNQSNQQWEVRDQSKVLVVLGCRLCLPPELEREITIIEFNLPGWDELLFVDLPNHSEREAIWKIQIAKYERDPKDFDTVQLSKATEGLTGSEIEAVFIGSLFQAFGEDTSRPTSPSLRR
jgi:hypothetical protein